MNCPLYSQVLPCELVLNHSLADLPEGNLMEKRICLQNFHALPTAASCFGDSGGPLVVCEDDRIVVIGVSSWGQGHCREEGVSVFVDVAMYVPWIRSKISEGNN